jgi:hypothetical protein
VFENKPLRHTRRVTTLYLSSWIFSLKVISFNMIHHLRRAAIGAHPFFVAPRFVPNTEQALTLATDEGKDRSERSDLRRLFLEKSSWRLGDAKAVA